MSTSWVSVADGLRIGINALFLIPGGVGGSEIYLRQLLKAVAAEPRGHHYVVFANRETGQGLAPEHRQFSTVVTGVRATSRPSRILYEQLILPFRTTAVDVMLNAGLTSPAPLFRPNVTVLFDLQHHHHPEFYRWTDLLATRMLLAASARWSRTLITLSEASRADIEKVYGIPQERTRIAPPGVDADLVALQRGEDEPFILYVSTLHPHKNHERLLDAFAEFRKQHPEYRLVLAGMYGFHAAAVLERIRQLDLEGSVTTTGWTSREQLLQLYQKARFAVFPSQFEGFGIPVLEALTAGVPLIVSDAAPMRDIAGGAGLAVDPADTQAWVDAMNRFASDPLLRADYARRGLVRSAEFQWSQTAATVLDAIEQAAQS